MRVVVSTVLSATLLAASSAFAQEPQTSEEIVKFFENAELGATRGICIGTEEQCRGKTKAAAPTGLDMLVNFELNSATLTPDARAKLNEFVKALNDERLKAHRFIVEGHTDASGPDTYNDRLSERRAESVTSFLLENGIEPSRIEAIGLGKKQPRTEDPFDPVNRRVEMRLNIAQ
jgi:OmpA-OmpF porin, OOP family